MKYEIIATLGPSSASPAIWQAMLQAGATAFRLNTSHLLLPDLHRWLDQLVPFLSRSDPPPPLVLDLQGSKWRLGIFKPFELETGQPLDLVCAAQTAAAGVLPVPHADFFKAAAQSSPDLLLNDAKVQLRVESAQGDRLQARVVRGGPIEPRKGITYFESAYRSEGLSEKDRAIVTETQNRLPRLHYALSYLRDAAELRQYRAYFDPAAVLIAKLERGTAVAEAAEMVSAADELWLCRGDLGAELGLAAMAEAVHRFSDRVKTLARPVMMAGQVLEHMAQSVTPTRSEICYLYDTLARGYQGVVLSDETATGGDPVESCRAAALFR